jgi:hypothetical protein
MSWRHAARGDKPDIKRLNDKVRHEHGKELDIGRVFLK